MMEYEPVSVDSARAILDELPTDVARVLESVPGFWQKHRRPPLATDRPLPGRALEWVGRLPAHVYPKATIARYARIINAIADAWADPVARTEMFDHLLNDRRVGRRGFPIDVEREISALCLYASSLP